MNASGTSDLVYGYKRVKTLHPRVHGGLLCRRDNPGHVADAENNGIGMIDLVCVNLYEFEKTVADPSVTLENANKMLKSKLTLEEFLRIK